MNNTLEKKHLNFGFEIKATSDQGSEFFEFEGYLSTFGNVDHGGDVVLKGAFTESLKERMPSLLWQHDMCEPVGVFTEVLEDDYGLYVKAKMPKSDSLVSGRIMPQMKVGSVRTMSIGFYVMSQDDIEYRENGVRALKKVTLVEGSLVTVPMNDRAQLTGFKSLMSQIDDLTEDEKKQLVEKIDNVKYTVSDVEDISTKTEFEKILRKAGFSKGAAQCLANKKQMFMGRSKSDDDEIEVNSELKSAINDFKSLLLELKNG